MSTHQDAELEDLVDTPAELVRAPTAPPFRPLQRRIGSIVPRDGAFDYRKSPSLMGGQRVPYRTQT
jgi:hypothetical protein